MSPVVYHGYRDDDGNLLSNMIGVDFELYSANVRRQFGDIIFAESFVAIRNFLADIQNTKIGERFEFKSKEGVIAMSFIRQEATLRIAGKAPTDESPWTSYSDFQTRLEREFETQVSFYCNFPIGKVPTVVNQMDSILNAINSS